MEIEKVKGTIDSVKKKAKIGVTIAIALMFISMIVVSVIQTKSGDITVKQMYWETDSGIGMSALLYVPSTATAKTPAPAIVTCHGAYNNKEMQDANCVELSRRGYVVLAPDQVAHGKSDIVGTNNIAGITHNVVYDSAQQLSRLPYVNKAKIGVTGHSAGGGQCNSAVTLDNNAKTNYIASVLLNSTDATYNNAAASGPVTTVTSFSNIYGTRDVGIISCVYDEFFNKSNDASGKQLSAPYYMSSPNAQSFLYFGTDPKGKPAREAEKMYHETINGVDVIRIIYRPAIIHPWSHFSERSTKATIEFFQETLGAPNAIASADQIWQTKEAFNFVGMIGFVLFIVSFAILMVYTPTFASLRADGIVQPSKADKTGLVWFWGSLVAGAVFSMVSYLPVVTNTITAKLAMTEPFAIACWAASCGLFTLICIILSYIFYGRKRGFSFKQVGITLSRINILKTLLLSAIVVSVAYAWVFFADYFFKSDFRIWTLGFKAFNPNMNGLLASLFPYFPLFAVYYVAVSMATNCFNYNQVGGKHTWVNTLIVSIIAGLPAIIVLYIQYSTYFGTNGMAWVQVAGVNGNPPMYVLWLFPMILILPVTTAVSRAVYKVTRNPYLPGIINALIITLFSCTNTRSAFLWP